MKQKKVFKILFVVFALILATLPLVVSFNDVLTKFVERFELYSWIQTTIVPWEIGIVGGIMKTLSIDFVGYAEGFRANGNYARLTWNCLGWQSLVFILVSFPIGFSAERYTAYSKVEAFIIGILGTFLINMARITFTILLLVYSKRVFAIVFHDYLAAIMTISWLTLFWWFSYTYVLVKRSREENHVSS